jgi:hypothetical protein
MVTQPRAGMPSLTAERWLNCAERRLLSRKLVISAMASEVSFSRAGSALCAGLKF